MIHTQTTTMHAMRYHRYGSADVLELTEQPVPEVGDDEVLVRIHAASVNPYDWHFLRGEPYILRLAAGIQKPKSPLLGVDLAGEVAAVGRNVIAFAPGDEVFGTANGAFAEYAVTRAKGLARKPANVSFAHAAAIPMAGFTALQGIRDKGKLRAGQRVLINGASGGVGTFAVQIAKSYGAQVTGVCSTRNMDLVQSLGADEVIDYTRDDFTQRKGAYDLLFDCIGNRPLSACIGTLKPSGAYVGVGAPRGNWITPFVGMLKPGIVDRFVSQSLTSLMAEQRNADLVTLAEMIAAGQVQPVIDRQYPLSELPEAIRYLETGRARGKVIIEM